MKKPDTKNIVVKKSNIHATGVFAKKDIKKREKVIEYVGEKITKAESEKRGQRQFEKHKKNSHVNGAVYLFTLNKKYDIDGYVPWNPAQYINHSCNPNCNTEIIRGHIWIIAHKDIKKGEEITYNYGYDLDNWEEHPCNCGEKNCVGYIVDDNLWPKLKKLIAKKK